MLFAQECDHGGLLAMEPFPKRGDQQLEREHARSLRHTHWIAQWEQNGLSLFVSVFGATLHSFYTVLNGTCSRTP